jgi:hypothetical protein
MVSAVQGDVLPQAGLNLLGLTDVAKTVGEARLGMVDLPEQQGRGYRQEQRNP